MAQASNPNVVAGAIAKKIRRGERVVLLSIGPGSMAVSVMATAYARQYLAENLVSISWQPSFIQLEVCDRLLPSVNDL